MAMQVGGAEGQSYSDINMTPLIDVMLVLLKVKRKGNKKTKRKTKSRKNAILTKIRTN